MGWRPRSTFKRRCLVAVLAVAAAAPGFARPPLRAPHADALLEGFRTPPPSARPRAWWHWMNGNVTERGIRLDLDWMKRIGLGGVVCIDASISTPQVVKRRLVYMTPEWDRAFRFAVRLAAKYGFEMGIDSSPGWSETGGPWVRPQDGMKKLVWSRTEIDGGRPFRGVLPEPPSNIGPFQNAKFAGDITPTPQAAALRFYRDSIVIAYRPPSGESAAPEMASNGGAVDAAALSDGDVTNGTTLTPGSENAPVWIRADFGKPAVIQGVTLAMSLPKGLGWSTAVEASDDGTAWRHVADFPPAAQLQRMVLVEQTISFPPAAGRYFRVVLQPGPPLPTSLRVRVNAPGAIEPTPPPLPAPRAYRVSELVFRTAATVHEFEKKAQFAAPPLDFYTLDSPPAFAPDSAIDPASVVDLTSRLQADGTLDWTPPPGRWIVLRMGYSLTGSENHPATAEATGLEVDKLNAEHVRAYLERYLDMYAKVTGPRLFGRRGLSSITVDSSEIGMQNWTENILAEFRRLRGYDPAPWLPVLTGAAVKSPADSDKFLWDFRRTIEELFARNHFGTIGEVARRRGLVNYGESIESHRPTFGDDMEMRQYTSIPMGAMWTYGERYPSALTYEADLLGAASVAHVYGQNLVGAESLTSAGRPWAYAPRQLKPFIDMEFARGVNRVVIHTSVHQPVDKAPGLSLFGYGQFFTRLESWADLAGSWIKYIARSSYLLQQGRFVADVAYFYGEEAPLTSLFGNQRVDDVPPGYGFDFVDGDALLNRLSVDGGDLTTASGMRYRALYLGGSSRRMTLATLRRIADLVRQGATLVGRRPAESPSLADDPAQFQAAAEDLFGPAGETAVRGYGKGKVYPSGALAEAFAALNLPPDFEYSKPEADTEILYLHRRLADGDLYFVSNRRDRPETVVATLRAAGHTPQIWDAVTGTVAPAPFTVAGGRTAVTLALPAYGSAFIVLRAGTVPATKIPADGTVLKTIPGPWTISFQPHRGAPARITQPALQSWSDSTIPGVRYFSGTAVYTTSFVLPRAAVRKGARLHLDLGELREIAQVSLNGRSLGTIWIPPFALDISKAARPGRNRLRITVANLWVNRLIGDTQTGMTKKYAYTIIPTYRPDAPLRPSGLLGPVVIEQFRD